MSLQQAEEMLSVSGSNTLDDWTKIGRNVTIPGKSEKIEENISVRVSTQIEASFASFLEQHI